MDRVEGVANVKAALERLKSLSGEKEKSSVVIGYTAGYALYVHENIEMKWKGLPRKPPKHGVYWGPHGQAKFLEQPFRELGNSGEIVRIVTEAMKSGASMIDALYIAGLRIQRESQALVPIDTGNLRASAFTVKE